MKLLPLELAASLYLSVSMLAWRIRVRATSGDTFPRRDDFDLRVCYLMSSSESMAKRLHNDRQALQR